MTFADNTNQIKGTGIQHVEELSPARHARRVTKGMWALTLSYFVRLKWQYLPLLLSDYGREILRRKYDAISTDMSYENSPSGVLGPIGKAVDRIVLSFPLHEGLRQRLRIVADSLKADATRRIALGEPRVRVLSAPSGVIRDLLTMVGELRNESPELVNRIELHALDLDATGEVIPMAKARADEARVDVTFHKEDLFNSPGLEAKFGRGEQFHIVNCIGLTPWLSLDEVEGLTRYFHDRVLADDGTLIIDNFAWHKHSALGDDLEINTRYHDAEQFVMILRKVGFVAVEENETANGINTVYVAKKGLL